MIYLVKLPALSVLTIIFLQYNIVALIWTSTAPEIYTKIIITLGCDVIVMVIIIFPFFFLRLFVLSEAKVLPYSTIAFTQRLSYSLGILFYNLTPRYDHHHHRCNQLVREPRPPRLHQLPNTGHRLP